MGWKLGTRTTEVKFGGQRGLYNVVIDGVEYTAANLHTVIIRDPKGVGVATIKIQGNYSVHAGKDCPAHINDYTADCSESEWQERDYTLEPIDEP